MRTLFARRIDETRLAVMFLTRLPVGRLSEPIPSLAEARWAFPLVGIVVAIAGWASQHGALMLGLGQMPAAFLALGAVALLTGGLHYDGMADFADGIGGGRDHAHRLEIMRDSRIGSYGVLALIFAISLTGGSLAAFEQGAPLALFLFLGVGSRLAMVAVLDNLPAARDEGLGRLAHATDRRMWMPGAIALMGIGLLSQVALWLTLIGVIMAAVLIAAIAHRSIGGQTGDVLGAVQIASETVGWLVAATLLAQLSS